MDESLFDVLGVDDGVTQEIKAAIGGYGKRPFLCACGKTRKHALAIFKHFAFDSSLCIAVQPAISARTVANLMRCGVFEEATVSESLLSLASDDWESVLFKDQKSYLHLARIFGQIMDLMELKLQYKAQSAAVFQSAATGAAELLGLNLNFNCYLDTDNENLVSTNDIFDGRFCSAVIMTFAILAAKKSDDATFDLTVVSGFGGVLVKLSFNCRKPVRLEALDHLKALAYYNHGIIFDIEKGKGRVAVSFIPQYQDVGFVGVKNGDELFDLVEYRELF